MATTPKIVVFTGGGIGDALFHVGHFQGLAARARDGRITLACKKGEAIAGLFEGMDFVERVIGLADDEHASGQVTPWRAARKLRAFGFDEIWCFHESTTIPLSAWLAGIPRRYGFTAGSSPRRILYTHCAETPREVAYPPLASRTDRLLTAFDVAFDTQQARLTPGVTARAAADALAPQQGIVALGLNGSVPSKQWGGQRFGALAEALARRGVEKFLLFGAGDVAEEAARTIERSGLSADAFLDLTTRGAPLSLGHALLARCQFYVGNDSSGLNLAAFSGVPAIGLFGVTDPLTYSPFIHPLLAEPVRSGMEAISVERVLAVCESMINRAANP